MMEIFGTLSDGDQVRGIYIWYLFADFSETNPAILTALNRWSRFEST